MNKLALALLGIVTVGTFSIPAQAQRSDNVLIQDSRQSVVQTGNGNEARQSSAQYHRESRQRGRDGSTGDVMTSEQVIDQFGDRNFTRQDVRQENVRESRSSGVCRRNCFN